MPAYFADILDEEQREDLVLVLAGVHTAAGLITARPEGAIEFFLVAMLRLYLRITGRP